ncbi:MAG: universal stress protein [Dehalococcoidia bacterium]|nr:universal stress protein [Dehalococcoidia bacterium]
MRATIKAQLIVMATRERSGLVRRVVGSVTDRVIHSSPIPMMVVPPDNEYDIGQWVPRSIIVPLDGSELAKTALAHAEAVERAAMIPITLVRSVSVPTTFGADSYGGIPSEFPNCAEEDIKAVELYLDEIAIRLRARGHQIGIHVGTGHPPNEICRVSWETENAMVVMTTRGASGLTRWVVGNVADSVIRSSGVPVLVIPPGHRSLTPAPEILD